MRDNGSARHHQNHHKIKIHQAVCSDPPSCPGPRPSIGQLEAKGGRLGQPNRRRWVAQADRETRHSPPFPPTLSGFSSPTPSPSAPASISQQSGTDQSPPFGKLPLLWDKPRGMLQRVGFPSSSLFLHAGGNTGSSLSFVSQFDFHCCGS